MTQVSHITKEQCLAMFGPFGIYSTLRELNRRISVVNELVEQATQDQFISAEQARALGAGNVEWYDDYSREWEVCRDEFDVAYKYRAIKKEVLVEPAEIAIAEQDQFISAEQARALGAGAEYQSKYPPHTWIECDVEVCCYEDAYKYRATKKEVPAEHYITADEARKLVEAGGKVEWSHEIARGHWYPCNGGEYSSHSPTTNEPIKYRAIKKEVAEYDEAAFLDVN